MNDPLEMLSNAELEMVASGNLDGLSTESLQKIATMPEDAPPEKADEEKSKDFAWNLAARLFPGLGQIDSPAVREHVVNLLKGEVSGLVRKDMGQQGVGGRAGEFIGKYTPATAAAAGAAALTGGASIPAQIAASGLAAGGAEAYQQLAARAVGGKAPETPLEAAKDIGIEAASQAAGEGAMQGARLAFRAMRPDLVKLGAQLIKATAGVPEKYGAVVLENPDILTKAPTMGAAQKMYAAAVRGMKGAQEYLQEKTGKILMKAGGAEDLINDVVPRLSGGNMPTLPEALAARQSASFLLEMAKMGHPEMKANKYALIGAKDALDNYLERGMPGFKQVSHDYFDANAREAFQSILPQNKNMSANVLRSLGQLSAISAAAVLHAPAVLVGAMPFSPRVWGMAIKAAASAPAAVAANFATRVAAKGIAGK